MTKTEIIQKLHDLSWPMQDYWVVAGGAMVLHGLRAETRDLDLGCTPARADALEAAGVPFRHMDNGGSRWFTLDERTEVFENWLADRVETMDGVPVVSLKGLRAMKEALGREKDRRDIARIDVYLQSRDLL